MKGKILQNWKFTSIFIVKLMPSSHETLCFYINGVQLQIWYASQLFPDIFN